MANLKTYAKLLRIIDARGYVLLALFGFFLAKGFLFPPKDIVVFWAIILSLLGFGFSINDCFDQKEDKFDKTKKNPLVAKEISFKMALTFSFVWVCFGLFFSALYGLEVFLICLTGVILTFFYSCPPFRLKSRPPFDLVSHGFFAGVFILLLPLLFFKTSLSQFYYLIIFSAFYFSVVLELRNEYEDYEIDKTAGLKTAAHILGYQTSEKLLRFLASFYPLALFPVFYLISAINPILPLLFLILTFIFLLLFFAFKNHKLVKNYKLLDGYNILSYCLILIAVL